MLFRGCPGVRNPRKKFQGWSLHCLNQYAVHFNFCDQGVICENPFKEGMLYSPDTPHSRLVCRYECGNDHCCSASATCEAHAGVCSTMSLNVCTVAGGRILVDHHWHDIDPVDMGGEFVHGEDSMPMKIAEEQGWKSHKVCWTMSY